MPVLDIVSKNPKPTSTGNSAIRVRRSFSALSRITHNVIHENLVERDRSLNVRAVVGNRVGVASTNALDRDGIRIAVSAGDRFDRGSVSPECDKEFPGLLPVRALRHAADGIGRYGAPTAALTADERAAAIRRRDHAAAA